MARALLVDGGGSSQLNLRGQLTGLEVAVVGEAAGMAEAQALLAAIRYDLVVATLSLPDGSGLDLVRWIGSREPAGAGSRPAVVLIGESRHTAATATAAGAAAYLVRPVPPGELTEAVRRALAERERTRGQMAVSAAAMVRKLPVAVGEKTLLLDPAEVFFAYAQDEQVFLKLSGQHIRCTYTLRDLELRLAPFGFVRTHRRYLTNLSRVREVLRYFKGALGLVMEDAEHSEVPVSRNLAQAVRIRLGL